MKNLLIKDFKLAVHPTNYLFLTFGAMLLIPTYPYYVAFFYTTLAIFFTFLNGRENNDILFTTLLPVAKGDIVRSRCAVIAIFELLSIALSIPFAVMNRLLYTTESYLTDCNVAFFGLVLGMFALFNAIFIPRFYKTGYKLKFLLPCVMMFVYMGVAETLAQLPVVGPYLDATSASGMLAQLPVLAAGILVFAGGMALTCSRSVSLFEKVDL